MSNGYLKITTMSNVILFLINFVFSLLIRKEADPSRRLWGISQWKIIGDNGTIRSGQVDPSERPHWLHVSMLSFWLTTKVPFGNRCYCIIPDGFVQSPLSCLPSVFPLLLSRNNGVEGTIRIGNRVGRKANQKMCSYILQDDNLFPWFTVLESMTLAARLKIGNKSHTYRQFMVKFNFYFIIKEWLAIN